MLDSNKSSKWFEHGNSMYNIGHYREVRKVTTDKDWKDRHGQYMIELIPTNGASARLFFKEEYNRDKFYSFLFKLADAYIFFKHDH
mgnify:CR=1 FL=1